MTSRYLRKVIYGILTVIAFTSCGQGKGGAVGEFNTIYATASTQGAPVDSDVAVWVDSAGAKATACVSGSIPTVLPNDIVVNILSTPFSTPSTGNGNTTILPSNLSVDSVTVTLTPANTVTPALPPLFQSISYGVGVVVLPNATQGVTVRVVSDALKLFLQPSLNCSGLMYSYHVLMNFTAHEVNSGKVGTFSTETTVTIADFIDK